jgi:hypothetical protein
LSAGSTAFARLGIFEKWTLDKNGTINTKNGTINTKNGTINTDFRTIDFANLLQTNRISKNGFQKVLFLKRNTT